MLLWVGVQALLVAAIGTPGMLGAFAAGLVAGTLLARAWRRTIEWRARACADDSNPIAAAGMIAAAQSLPRRRIYDRPADPGRSFSWWARLHSG
ncbi:MAG: hypothetical protein U0Z44_21915 [Kouleothrix sp.]